VFCALYDVESVSAAISRNVVSVKQAFMFVITEFMSKVYEYIRTFPEQARYAVTRSILLVTG
jgi:hypothetical protein